MRSDFARHSPYRAATARATPSRAACVSASGTSSPSTTCRVGYPRASTALVRSAATDRRTSSIRGPLSASTHTRVNDRIALSKLLITPPPCGRPPPPRRRGWLIGFEARAGCAPRPRAQARALFQLGRASAME
ncbi:hypothetical protein HMPREF1550_00848 [Actinomyces sp. oral taxon 877 str. F0543]|nr:hypothetical protein HMPREF1550_00848 [Actinomyces sp. oral taxon 877 str. F0543]